MAKLDKLTIRGFKSIAELKDFELGNLTVLIGANGAGKSNFVQFFSMLRAMSYEGLNAFILRNGGADNFLFNGPKFTSQIAARLEFARDAYTDTYTFALRPTADDGVMFQHEGVGVTDGSGNHRASPISKGARESALPASIKALDDSSREQSGVHHALEAILGCRTYHFHDTSSLAWVRRYQPTQDVDPFREDGSNLAAYLLDLRITRPATYELVRDTIRLVAPFFNDFELKPTENGGDPVVNLDWRQRGNDFLFRPSQLSDGTLRFACLATALMQPEPPACIVLDEPELGLHPYAIAIIGDLIRNAAKCTQVIVATQSPQLLDRTEPSEVVVVSRDNGRSTFKRLDEGELDNWLDEYSLGELWRKGVVQGGPMHE